VPTRARRLGYVLQGYALFPHLAVAQNIGYGLHGWQKARQAHRVAEVLGRLGLAGLARRYPRELSGGQQQRVALGRALAPDPAILLLDEPLSALDAPLRRHLRAELVATLQDWGKTTVLVTHDIAEAYELADQIIIYDHGRVLQSASRLSRLVIVLTLAMEQDEGHRSYPSQSVHPAKGPIVGGGNDGPRPEHSRDVPARLTAPSRTHLGVATWSHDLLWGRSKCQHLFESGHSRQDAVRRPSSEAVDRIMGMRNILRGTVVRTTPERIWLRWRDHVLEAVNPSGSSFLPRPGRAVSFHVRPELVRLIRKDRPSPDPARHRNLLEAVFVGGNDLGTARLLAARIEQPGEPAQGDADLEIELSRSSTRCSMSITIVAGNCRSSPPAFMFCRMESLTSAYQTSKARQSWSHSRPSHLHPQNKLTAAAHRVSQRSRARE
jgi:energy-coupling factor transporter ATP-binding protein EcfA2